MNIDATIIGQMITFALLVLFTMKFVWPPLNRMLEERSKRIADGLAAAEKGKQELLDVEAKVAEELKHVQLRATEIMTNAERRAEQIVTEAKDRATKEGSHILADAKSQIDQEIVKAREQLRKHVAVLAIKGAEKILKAEINQEKHEKLLASIKAEL